MNNTARTLCLAVAIMAGLASESMAAGDHRGGPRLNFEEVDANADGLLSRDEMQAHREARFAATDADGNGTLSRAEIEAHMVANQDARRVKFLDRMFDRRDTDADGELSMTELGANREAKLLERADANGDGLISKAEFDAAKEAGRNAKNRVQ